MEPIKYNGDLYRAHNILSEEQTGMCDQCDLAATDACTQKQNLLCCQPENKRSVFKRVDPLYLDLEEVKEMNNDKR